MGLTVPLALIPLRGVICTDLGLKLHRSWYCPDLPCIVGKGLDLSTQANVSILEMDKGLQLRFAAECEIRITHHVLFEGLMQFCPRGFSTRLHSLKPLEHGQVLVGDLILFSPPESIINHRIVRTNKRFLR